MPEQTRFKVNQPTVIGEVIDDEAIIVNLDSGAYYSLRGTGAAIWQMVEQGGTVADIISQLAAQYDVAAKATVESGVAALLTELQQEQLIVPATGTQPNGTGSATFLPLPNGPFETPVLEKYTDMADLLLLDPIHEVDEAGGWPHPPASEN